MDIPSNELGSQGVPRRTLGRVIKASSLLPAAIGKGSGRRSGTPGLRSTSSYSICGAG